MCPQAAGLPRPRVICIRPELSGGGTASMPVREKGEGARVRRLRVPSHVPSHPQTAAKVRGFSLTASGFTAETDWLLEGTGFEPLVPADARTAGGHHAAYMNGHRPAFWRSQQGPRSQISPGGKRIRTAGPTSEST